MTGLSHSAALAPVAPKLAKLIPLLGSDRDGEALATVRALERTLRAAGLDFHALAAAVEHEEAQPVHHDDDPYPDIARGELRQMAEFLYRECRYTLTVKEQQFINSMTYKLAAGLDPTPRQKKWIVDLFDRYQRRAS
ncbi:hypothetical protein [Sphingosinicella xenopeptidilytica]|uniref:Uncharacterized protein n=1 Tax=Sphingosinicella xenopeptidilytica TaxID=364098 RepID=A0ABW3BYK1_SPHXN